MKTLVHIFLLTITLSSSLFADLTEKITRSDKAKFGKTEELSIYRNGILTYVLFRHDPDGDGTFDNFIECFYVEGRLALKFTLIGGSRGTIFQSDSQATIILSSKTDSWKPQSILIESDRKVFEYFDLQPDGLFRPISDADKKQRDNLLNSVDSLSSAVVKGDGKAALDAVNQIQDSPPPKAPSNTPESSPPSITVPPNRKESK